MTTPNLSAEGEKVLEELKHRLWWHGESGQVEPLDEARALLAAHEQRCKAEELEEFAKRIDSNEPLAGLVARRDVVRALRARAAALRKGSEG